jgi:3-oxoacyl-[acyl-carrier-protein] synthase-3
MRPVSLVGTASYLPETVIGEEFFGAAVKRKGPMFMAPTTRRHAARDESATDMIERAARKLTARLNLDPSKDIDIVLTNVSVPDQPFTGCGAEVQHRLGTRAKWIFDLHNTGCVSFVYMLALARVLLQTTSARTAILCNVQNAAGRIFSHPELRGKPQAQVPGDGCGVSYVVASDESPVLSLVQHTNGDFASDMVAVADDHHRYWEPGTAPFYIDFTDAKIAQIISRGNRIVPEVIGEALREAEVAPSAIDLLVTNQPNPIFLRNWREALELPKDKHADTFDAYGNLFGAGIPITLDEAIAAGRLPRNALLAIGGFSHAGDYAAAAIIRWQKSA